MWEAFKLYEVNHTSIVDSCYYFSYLIGQTLVNLYCVYCLLVGGSMLRNVDTLLWKAYRHFDLKVIVITFSRNLLTYLCGRWNSNCMEQTNFLLLCDNIFDVTYLKSLLWITFRIIYILAYVRYLLKEVLFCTRVILRVATPA